MLAGRARAATPLRIGVLGDLAGSQALGLGAIAAARIAAEEVGSGAVGRPIEVVSADAGGNPEFGATIVRNWIASDGVEAVACVVDDTVALAVQAVCRREGRLALLVGPTSRALSGSACSATGFQWLADTRANARGLAAALLPSNVRTAFVLAETWTHELADEIAVALDRAGVTVKGQADPGAGLPAALAAATASGAAAVVVAGGMGPVVAGAMRLPGRPVVIAAGMTLVGVQEQGQRALAGALAVLPFYWDTEETGRFWSRRFMARTQRMPEAEHIGVYEAVRQYLRIVAEIGRSDGQAVARRMRFTPVDSAFTRGGRVSADGRVLRPLLVARVKPQDGARDAWDMFAPLTNIPAEAGGRAEGESQCPLVRGG